MLFLIAAILGLCAGPLLFTLLHRSERPQLAVDGFVLVAVVGLVVLHVLPDAVEVAGMWALLAAAVGLVIPLAAEKVRALSHRTSHGVVLGAALFGMLLHASLDGVGLGGSSNLGLAVVLHRIPVGLGIWWLVRPQFGRGWAVAVLAAICLATIGGFALQTTMVAPGDVVWIQVVQALVAGSLLHVVLHQSVGLHNHSPVATAWRFPGAIGATLGALLVGALPDAHTHAVGESIVDATLLAAPVLVPVVALILVARRKRALETLDAIVPWGVAFVTLGALFMEVDTIATPLNITAAIVCGVLALLSLAHQGPRRFVLTVLPLDLISSGHDHGHDHSHHHHDHHDQPAHDHAPLAEGHPS